MDYELVIGLEVHVRLDTASKIFCGDSNDFGLDANQSISAISLSHPGTLPVVNHVAVESGILLGLAIEGEIANNTSFDRKHYFYPDLPKAYQLTQDAAPISVGGKLSWEGKSGSKEIRFHHIHMEEDAGKSMHDKNVNGSMIDYNRAGVPLIEMVTEPDFRSGEEVYEFLAELQQLLRYLGISNADMEKGSMRCDCNVSIRPVGSDELNERCEIKNLNSKRFARQAVEAEGKRQAQLSIDGKEVIRATLQYDTVKNTTSPLRLKESVSDYRYFPDPDLPSLLITEDRVARIKASMPLLPKAMFKRLVEEYKLTSYQAEQIYTEKSVVDYFLEACTVIDDKTSLANFIINSVLPFCQENELNISEYPLKHSAIDTYLDLISSNKVSSSVATQELLPILIVKPNADPAVLAESLNLIQADSSEMIIGMAQEIVHQFPDKVKAYRNGKKGLIGFFMGQAMRNSDQKVDPNKLKEAITACLES